SMKKKMETLLVYNNILLAVSSDIKTTNVTYRDAFTTLQFANSEGTLISQEKMDMGCNLYAIANKDGKTKFGGTSIGTSNDWNDILGLEEILKEKGLLAINLLTAPLPKSGKYTVILNPNLAGTFIHEAFGHLSEGDNVYEDPELAGVMKMGREFGRPILNVYDTGLDEGVRGYLKYDDEGVPTEKTWLIREGKLSGRLHSRETAGKMGERATGSARAINYKHPPIPRMRNTCIQKGDTKLDDMIASIKDGILCQSVFGGQTNGEMFTFKSGYAYRIENGKKTELLDGPMLQGNVFDTLGNISAIGDDYIDPDSAGGCGKGGQMPLPTTHGSPSICIEDVIVSGD
ncbi:MAG: TldD/PmbA family protein, partial [Caldisericia bacterium]|nr:TldD/PmbA family protein [Caldisericia bacterium]